MRAIRMLRSRWRGLETESRLGLHGHERGNPGHRQGHNLTDHRASPRPYQVELPAVDVRMALCHSAMFVASLSGGSAETAGSEDSSSDSD